MQNIYSFNLYELQTILPPLGFKKYSAEQVLRWLYQNRVSDFSSMSNISETLRNNLKNVFSMSLPSIKEKKISSDNTIKYLLELEDGNLVETVLMRYTYGNALCVSSQVGCAMGCSFCASGLLNKVRSLTIEEMVGQVLVVQKEFDLSNERISHVVIMGIGEPFDNYENVMAFIKIINEAKGLAIGARHISVSTCGLVDKIKKFALEPLQINLAISLHSAIDEKRSKIMKINKVHNLVELKNAIIEYEQNNNRRVTFEYILLDGVNDSEEDAIALAKYLKGTCSFVNLIPYNETKNSSYRRSKDKNVDFFYNLLKKLKINVTIRREFGSDIDAACGQLRAKSEVKKI